MDWAFRYRFRSIFFAGFCRRIARKLMKWCSEPNGQSQLQKNRPKKMVNITVTNAHNKPA